MLTPERIDEIAGPADYWDRRVFARAIEAAACAPLLERIAELEAERDQVRWLFNKSKDEFHTARQESSLRWQMICDLTNQRDALEAKLAQRVPDENAAFEAEFKMPSSVVRCGDGYAATEYGAWQAHSFIESWRGWKARSLLAAAPAAPEQQEPPPPIDMVLHCPACGKQHVDEAETDDDYREKHLAHGGFDDQWTNPPHRSHLCHGCGHIWRPADVPTNGVAAVKTKGKADSQVAQAPNAQQAEPMSRIAKTKLADLIARGYQECGVMIEMGHSDGRVTRGAVSDGGMVIWWHPEQMDAAHTREQQAEAQPVMVQFRWTNPGDNPSPTESEVSWQEVTPRNRLQNIQDRIGELLAYEYNGRKCYEIRYLYTAQPKAVPLTELQRLSMEELEAIFHFGGDVYTNVQSALAAKNGMELVGAPEEKGGE